MKTILLTLVLVLTGLELRAQQLPPGTPTAAQRRLARFGNTNGPVTQPRYLPQQQPAPGTPGAGAAPGAPGAPGGAPPAAPLSSSYSASSAFAAKQEEMIAPGMIDFEGVEVSAGAGHLCEAGEPDAASAAGCRRRRLF